MPQNTQTNYKQNKNTHAQPTACHILHQQNYHTSTVSINNTLHIFTTTPAYGSYQQREHFWNGLSIWSEVSGAAQQRNGNSIPGLKNINSSISS